MFSERRGWFFRAIWPVTHYLFTNLCVLFGRFFFQVLNGTTVIGRENVPHQINTLLLSNHQTMIDSFLVGSFVFFPKVLIRPSLMPWNPAAEENFYSNPILGWFSDNWKCIPIKKGRKDVGAIFRMAQALRKGTMTLFPEGTRTRDGSIGRARGGAGLLILETKPNVIPVYIDGMDKVLPIGRIIPRLFNRIHVCYGKPLDLSEFYGQEPNKETSQKIMQRVMDEISLLRSKLYESMSADKATNNNTVFESKEYDSQKA